VGTNQSGPGTFPNGVIVVKNWQVFLTLVLWLVTMVAGFTQLHDHAEESSRRIRDLEQRPVVTEQQYVDGQQALTQRLERIEKKLDEADLRAKK
jgi:hypothetical protein